MLADAARPVDAATRAASVVALRERDAQRASRCHGSSGSQGSRRRRPSSRSVRHRRTPRRASRCASSSARTAASGRVLSMTRKRRGLGGGALEIGVAHALEERVRLALELVERRGPRACARVEPRARHVGRHVEEKREVGLAVAVDPLLELADARDGHAVPAALIGVGRVGEAVAEHPVARGPAPAGSRDRGARAAPRTSAAPRCRASSARAAAASRSRSPSGVPPGSRVATTRVPARLEASREPGDVRALAGAVDAFEGDEAAGGVRSWDGDAGNARDVAASAVARAGILPRRDCDRRGSRRTRSCRRRARRNRDTPSSADWSPRRARPAPATRSASAARPSRVYVLYGVSVSRSRLRRLPSKLSPSP